MLHTTRKLLRQAGACKDRYALLVRATRKMGYGATAPIPLAVAIETNGLEDALWAFRAVVPGEEGERDRIGRLFGADCAEHVAHLYTLATEWQPAHTIDVVRRYASGLATYAELAAARDAAWAAWAAAGDVARDAERDWQRERLLWYLDGRQ